LPLIKGSDLLFTGATGRTAFSGLAKAKARLHAEMTRQLGTEPPAWALHDIRRTVATGMAEIGVQPHVIEAVLNHVSGHKAGVAGVYNRASYAGEMAAALDKWAGYIKTIVSPANVVPLRRPAP
jgi:hypothetical protein